MKVFGIDLSTTDLLGIFFVLIFILPFLQMYLQRRYLIASRASLIRQIEKDRKSRVITLIHRQEGASLLGIPVGTFIDVEDSEQILRAIRFTPKDVPIDMVMHTPGGIVLAATQIALALKRHPGGFRVIVPHYAMSGGTLIALAADRIIMDENAVLGPIDPQIGAFLKSYPAASLLAVSKIKDVNETDDDTLVYIDVAKKAIEQTRKLVCELLDGRMEEKKRQDVCEKLTEGVWTHDHPLTYGDLGGMGLKVELGVPNDIYELMDLYPQPRRFTPTVEYIPVPYKRSAKDK